MKKRGLLRSASLVSANTLLSRILGFVRDMVVAQIFGATGGLDAFLVAFKLPNFMRRLFAEGAFSQAFVPVLSEYQLEHPHEKVREFVHRIAGSLAFVLLIVSIVGMLLAPLLVMIFAPGFEKDSTRFLLASHMLRITFPYLLFISLTAFSGAVLNTYGRYGIPAFTPVLLNICIIIAAIWGRGYFSVPIYALAWAVFVAGVVQLLFQIPFLISLKLPMRFKWGFQDEGVKRVLKLMVPALFGVSVAQLSLLIDTIFASFLKVGSISWLYYSERLMNFPLGIFGVGIATVVLPHLSRSRTAKNHESYSQTLDWALRSLLIIGIPSSIALFILAGPLLATLLHYGKFNTYDVLMSRESLMAFSIGIQSFMLIKVLASGFYAHQNIKTPVKIAAFAMVCNMFLNLALIFPLKHAGLALATSISGYINAGLLMFFMMKKQLFTPQKGWSRYSLQLFLANALMGVFLYFAAGPLKPWLDNVWQWRALHLLYIVIAAVAIYFVALFALGVRLKDFRIGGKS
jgi:putative peptidoglycan lipid II flippase